jgi:hypothetical protein
MTLAADRQAGGEAPLVDVSEVPISDIFGTGTALAGALERLAGQLQSHEDLYAGFGNFAPDQEPLPAVTGTQEHHHPQ